MSQHNATREERVCIIGAGPSGLTAAKNLKDAGFRDITIFDRGDEVGGNWVFDAQSGHSSVFETTHIISSREYSQFEDFPLPPGTPDYPGHKHLADYFQRYAREFDLYPLVRFRRLVEHAELEDDGRWRIQTRDAGSDEGQDTLVEHFNRLVVANGHHWKPRWPKWPGTFEGQLIHSHDFKRAADFKDQRVLVVGAGNSACDCAVETSRVSETTHISWRRGYWIVPKFIFGQPSDLIYNRAVEKLSWIPIKARFRFLEKMLRIINGPNSAYGLPEPDHRFGETHPTVNSELLYFIRHGDIHPRPDIERTDGNTVHFKDGTSDDFDVIIACTGFELSHPFFDSSFIDYSDGPVPLYRKMIHPTVDSVAFIGLFQPIGCIWPLAELQSRLLAKWWTGRWSPPEDREAAIDDELANPHVHQLATPRHTITVDYPTFRRELKNELRSASPPG